MKYWDLADPATSTSSRNFFLRFFLSNKESFKDIWKQKNNKVWKEFFYSKHVYVSCMKKITKIYINSYLKQSGIRQICSVQFWDSSILRCSSRAYRSFFHFAKSLAAGKLPRYYKCRGFFDERRMRANIPSRSIKNQGFARATANAMREYAWAAAREDATKVRFAAETEILRFRREFCVSAERFRPNSPGFGISEMRCRVRGMFITKFYYSLGKRSQLYVTLRDAPYYYTTREQCVPLPYTQLQRSAPQSAPFIKLTHNQNHQHRDKN